MSVCQKIGTCKNKKAGGCPSGCFTYGCYGPITETPPNKDDFLGTPKTCKWIYDLEHGQWITACVHTFEMAVEKGTPSDCQFKYCMYCGREIRE